MSEIEYDFSEVPDDAINEFHRQAELWLEGTVKVAIAADSRATTLTGILGAATAASFVLGGNLAGSPNPNYPLVAAVVSAAIVLLAATGFCAAAARPVHFYVSGYEPKILYDAAGSEKNIKRVSTEDIQRRIDRNTACLRSASEALLRGRIIALAAIPTFVIVFCLFHP